MLDADCFMSLGRLSHIMTSRDGVGISMSNMYVITMSGLVRVYGVGSELFAIEPRCVRLGIIVHESAYRCVVHVT